MKYRALIWGTGHCLGLNINYLRLLEMRGDMEIVSVTSRDNYKKVGWYDWIREEDIKVNEYDIVIAMVWNDNYFSVLEDALRIGFLQDQVIPFRAFTIFGFDIKKYMELRKNPPSIFSNNCWGGFTYSSLGIQYKSPTVGIYIDDVDYMKFLKSPKKYVDVKFLQIGDGYHEVLKKTYPIVQCNDIVLHLDSYSSVEDANRSWNRRAERINWDNVFVKFHTEKMDMAKEFLQLPYSKVCFVPFESDEDELVFIPDDLNNYGRCINASALGRYLYYDLFDLLLRK